MSCDLNFAYFGNNYSQNKFDFKKSLKNIEFLFFFISLLSNFLIHEGLQVSLGMSCQPRIVFVNIKKHLLVCYKRVACPMLTKLKSISLVKLHSFENS